MVVALFSAIVSIWFLAEGNLEGGFYSSIPLLIMIFYYSIQARKQKEIPPETTIQTSVTSSKQRRHWDEIDKEQVRNRQNGRCNMCGKIPPRWEYDHIDGDRSNNSRSNCQGLCPNCHSVKTHDMK